MQFSGNFEQILGSRPPWGQNSTAPDQNPGSAPDTEVKIGRESWAILKIKEILDLRDHILLFPHITNI